MAGSTNRRGCVIVLLGCVVLACSPTGTGLSQTPQPATPVPAMSDAQVWLDRIGVLTLTVGIRPVKNRPDLRSVLLHRGGLLIEPHGMWPDGTLVSADAEIAADEAVRVIEILRKRDFLAKAGKYFSERQSVDPKFPPPAGAANYVTGRSPDSSQPGFQVTATTFDDHWYTYHEASYGVSAADLALIGDLVNATTGKAQQLLETLAAQLR